MCLPACLLELQESGNVCAEAAVASGERVDCSACTVREKWVRRVGGDYGIPGSLGPCAEQEAFVSVIS